MSYQTHLHNLDHHMGVQFRAQAAIRAAGRDLLNRVLVEVNAIRAEFYLAPLSALPKGSPKQAKQCVIARALAELHPAIGARKADFGNTRRLMSPTLTTFVAAFDAGRYPELVA